MDLLASSLVPTLRGLARRPGFAASVVLTLALGIGAPLTIFAVVDALLLRQLPYPEPGRLVLLWQTVERDGVVERRSFSMPDFVDLQAASEGLELLAAWQDGFGTLRGEGRAERLPRVRATPEYFDLLGAELVRGRRFEAADEILISHRLWQTRFGGRDDVLGTALELDDAYYRIVGVLAPGFVDLADGTDLWLPFDPTSGMVESRGTRGLSVAGRLAPERSLESVRDELTTVFAALEQSHPDSNRGYRADLAFLREELFGDFRVGTLALLGAVALVLALALVNVAHLLLVRGAARSREVALRLALGAGRAGLFGTLLLEATVLAAAAGGVALLLALWGIATLRVWSPVPLPDFVELRLSPPVLALAVGLVVATGAVLAFVAWRQASRVDLAPALGHGTVSEEPRRRRARSLLLALEVALTLVPLIAAGWLLESLRELEAVDLGFRQSEVVFFDLGLPTVTADDADARSAAEVVRWRQIQEELRSIPGVRSASLATDSPLRGGYSALVVSPEGRGRDDAAPYAGGVRVYGHLVAPDYFATLGLPLLEGRAITASDRIDTPGVAVVDRAMAERHWPGEPAVGKRFKLGVPPEEEGDADAIEWVTVIGVVAEARHRDLVPDPEGRPADPDVYFALAQFGASRTGLSAMLAAEGEAEAVLGSVRPVIERVDPAIAVYGLETLGERLGAQTARWRFNGSMMSLFAGLALMLAAVGIYGVVAYRVAQRTREIGLRMALGADRRQVLREVLLAVARPVLVGAVVGALGARLVGRLLDAALFQVSVGDPRVFLVSVATLLLVAALAALGPALRASRIEPVRALADE